MSAPSKMLHPRPHRDSLPEYNPSGCWATLSYCPFPPSIFHEHEPPSARVFLTCYMSGALSHPPGSPWFLPTSVLGHWRASRNRHRTIVPKRRVGRYRCVQCLDLLAEPQWPMMVAKNVEAPLQLFPYVLSPWFNFVVNPHLSVSSSQSCASNSDKHAVNVLLPHTTARLQTRSRFLTVKPHSNLLHNAVSKWDC